MTSQLSYHRSQIIGKLALLDKCERELSDVQTERSEIQNALQSYSAATQILRDLYEQTQERFHGQIMQIVSFCLKEVFGVDAYEFKIVFEQKRGQVESRCAWIRDDKEFNYDQIGGGILDVSAMALRLSVIYLTRKTVRSIMIMDEPFRYLSVEYREKMAALLVQLSAQFDFQFIIVTHIPEFELGKTYRFGKSQTNTLLLGRTMPVEMLLMITSPMR